MIVSLFSCLVITVNENFFSNDFTFKVKLRSKRKKEPYTFIDVMTKLCGPKFPCEHDFWSIRPQQTGSLLRTLGHFTVQTFSFYIQQINSEVDNIDHTKQIYSRV